MSTFGKGDKLARVNCIQLEDNDLKAQDDYDNLFYKLDSDSEEGNDQQDFRRPVMIPGKYISKL